MSFCKTFHTQVVYKCEPSEVQLYVYIVLAPTLLAERLLHYGEVYGGGPPPPPRCLMHAAL